MLYLQQLMANPQENYIIRQVRFSLICIAIEFLSLSADSTGTLRKFYLLLPDQKLHRAIILYQNQRKRINIGIVRIHRLISSFSTFEDFHFMMGIIFLVA